MIDFRYHLVSILSIFLALAVGIALGAGPLNQTLADTLNTQVTSLRKDKADLKSQVDALDAAVAKRDAYAAATLPLLLHDRLAGTTVDLVALPSTDAALLRSTRQTLTQSGATIGAVVEVKGDWTADDAQATRDTVAADQQVRLGLEDVSGSDIPMLDRVLAAALQPTDEQRPQAEAALKALEDADLVSVDGGNVEPATSVVVLSGGVNTGDTATDTKTATTYAVLAAAIDAAGRGSVLASNTGVTPLAAGVSVVSTARSGGSATSGLTTVDDAATPMGQASVVYGLLEQLSGGAGAYGMGADAGSVAPPLAAP